ncbi:MAG: cell division protein ZapA [Gammaproteobacteria bacterium]|nr:cell division protein ZapA [Gammaproteobacteria bacterium]NIR81933.1 cell division protein ZapA [Gammaproteobacteria bacterium]NIR88765.1 cell division protein ZapA [Gammaproteobacteria bacterium]NIU03041.1 cell division protein ZapA [Gammaproteobacteria bacterium]NIV50562.1 cell division protein ZapA [Gammaproteobacteria bacterium]
MSSETVPVRIHILDKEYMVSCPVEERDALIESARYLDRRMREIRDSGKVLGSERIAVMAALNVIHEFSLHKRDRQEYESAVAETARRLETKLETALGRRTQRETVD